MGIFTKIAGNINVNNGLTGPGAEGSHYGHSARQETWLSVFPASMTTHTLNTGRHVPSAQHHYVLCAGLSTKHYESSFFFFFCKDQTTKHKQNIGGCQGESITNKSKSSLKHYCVLHILWQFILESSRRNNNTVRTLNFLNAWCYQYWNTANSKQREMSRHSIFLFPHTHTLTWVALQSCLRCGDSENLWKARGFAGGRDRTHKRSIGEQHKRVHSFSLVLETVTFNVINLLDTSYDILVDIIWLLWWVTSVPGVCLQTMKLYGNVVTDDFKLHGKQTYGC